MIETFQTPATQERYSAAIGLAHAGEVSGAIAELSAIVAENPHFAVARNDLATLLFSIGQVQRAKVELSLAFGHLPTDPLIVENYLEILLATNSLEEVFPKLHSMVSVVNTNTSLIARISEVLSNRSEEAQLKEWDRAIEGVTQKITDQILPFLPNGGVLVDVGANCGLFTEQVLRRRSVRAYLFEPVPKYFRFCQAKFKSNPNIKVENVALAESTGSLRIFVDRENLGWNTLVESKCTPGMTPIDIATDTFDSFAVREGISEIDVIKIDVEGAEFRVLKGMRETLVRLAKKPVIICEVAWGPKGHPNWSDEVEAFEWLFANGYTRVDYNVSGTSDLIFMPK